MINPGDAPDVGKHKNLTRVPELLLWGAREPLVAYITLI